MPTLCASCLCPLVKDGAEDLPGTYCYCSLGWVKENLTTVVGKPVDVELVESIMRGSDRFKFIVRV